MIKEIILTFISAIFGFIEAFWWFFLVIAIITGICLIKKR